MTIPFQKWHGLGNDFVVVRATDLPEQLQMAPASLASWCDRHRAVGADGVLVLSNESDAAFDMLVVNADGSVPEICGNGIRCAVRAWAAQVGFAEGTVAVGTGAGTKDCKLSTEGLVSVEMGPAQLSSPSPPESGERDARLTLDVGGAAREGIAVSMGNPHLVFLGPSPIPVTEAEAMALETHSRFPNRTNVEFAHWLAAQTIEVRVWERGVGYTQACGSGACAVAVCAVLNDSSLAGTPLEVRLPGGSLFITVSDDLNSVLMTGPAQLVFSGVLG